MKKMKYLWANVLACCLLCSITVSASEIPKIERTVEEMPKENEENVSFANQNAFEKLGQIEIETTSPILLSEEQKNQLSTRNTGIRQYTATDKYEPNDTWDNAYPYNQCVGIGDAITQKHDLYRLGMKNGSLHSETDEDWYSVNLTAGETYFVDLRNVGRTNWFIELYYLPGNYFYTTNPFLKPVYEKKPEKYFYFKAEDTGTYHIRITSGGDWEDRMYYYFYVGPAIQTFEIKDMLTYGGVKLFGGTYRSYNCDFSDGYSFPKEMAIINLSLKDDFPTGSGCAEVDKYMRAGGKTYYNTSGTGSSVINNIAQESLGQNWTIGGRCAKNTHFTDWSVKINGRFACIMEPYPGNELSY